MTGSNMMVFHHILAETFGKFWITNIHSAGSVEEDRIIGLPGLQIRIIYRRPINSEADLRVRIQEAFVSVTEEMITNATTRSLLRRAQLCIQMNGGHFEHLF
ncbi:unnamed protein product [Tenebrio molitor]|jgi:hypothetical protein|nr:unnamed protein product [Tenebrio molitor]